MSWAMRPRFGTPALVLLSAFVACVWLNQSVGGKDWEGLRDQVFAAPRQHIVELARYPFVFLYRRSLDERYYFEVASSILGEPADGEVIRHMHGAMPPGFRQDLPPADGRWHTPYVEVPLEYPPLNVPAIVLPRLLASTFKGYGFAFGGLMGLCLFFAIATGIDIARRGESTAKAVDRRWLLATGLLLAQGALAVQRLDPIATLCLALGVRAAVRRRTFAMGVMTGLAGAAKVTPLLVLPVLVAADATVWREPRKLARVAVGAALGLLVPFAPVVALAPHAALEMLRYHAARGLNVESTFGVALGIGRRLFGHVEAAPASFGSQNFVGPVPDFLAAASGPVTLVAVAWLTWVVAKRASLSAPAPDAAASEPTADRARVQRITVSALLAVLVIWLTGKVFSPQYLTWGIPLVLAIPGREGTRLAWGAIVAMGLTQLYFRGFYDLVVEQHTIALLVLGVRQAVLVGLGAVAARLATGPWPRPSLT
jgi:hypothetical protein